MGSPTGRANVGAMDSSSDERTPDPGIAPPSQPPPSQPPHHGPPWGWIVACVLLLVVAGGLAVWAFGLDSKLDDQRDQTAKAQQQADQAQQQADQATEQAQSLSGDIDEINASVA